MMMQNETRRPGVARIGRWTCMLVAVALLAVPLACQQPATGTQGMVSSAHPLATEAGLRILAQGGKPIIPPLPGVAG